MKASDVAEIITEAKEKGRTVLCYIPCPWLRGWINVKPQEVVTLTRGRDEDIPTDYSWNEGSTMVSFHLGELPPL